PGALRAAAPSVHGRPLPIAAPPHRRRGAPQADRRLRAGRAKPAPWLSLPPALPVRHAHLPGARSAARPARRARARPRASLRRSTPRGGSAGRAGSRAGSRADGAGRGGNPVNGEPLLRVEHLTKHFPVTRGVLGKVVGQVRAVDDVSFTLGRGETLGLVGES